MSDHQNRANAGQSHNLPVVFRFEEHTLRAVHIEDKEVFVANDACAMLELANSRKAIANLDDDEKGVTTIQTAGGPQEVNVVTESGLYNLIFLSRKPKAKAIRRWVTHDVLPALRKTGRYELGQKAASEDKTDSGSEGYARDRLFKIYREGHLNPDDLLRALFGKNIPYTSSRRHPFFLTECCEALGISETAAARRLDYSDIATIEVEAGEDRVVRRAITEAALHFLAFSRRSLEPKQAEDQNSNQNSEDWIHIPKSNVGRYILSILPDGKHHYYRSDYNHVIYEADQMNVLALCHSLKTVQALWMAYEEFLEFGIDPCGEHPVRALDDAITRAAIQADRFIEIYTKLAQRKDGAGDDPRNPRRAPGKPMGNA